MSKENVVKRLYENGILISPDLLEKVDEESVELLLGSAETIVTTLPKNKITVTYPITKEMLGIDDYIAFYNEKFEGIKSILMKKVSPTSISNLGKDNGDASIIGMVKEIVPGGLVLEDPTGQIEIRINEKPTLGDVIAVNGRVERNVIVGSALIYPDIPLPKEVRRFSLKFILTYRAVDSVGTQIVLGDVEAGNNIVPVKLLPAKININGVEILAFDGKNPINYLKRRIIPGKITSRENFSVIRNVPDIVCIPSDTNKIESYKGTTIIFLENGFYANVNMFTRKIEFVKV